MIEYSWCKSEGKSILQRVQKTLNVDIHDGKERQVCRSCGMVYYENPLPVASIIVPNHEREIIW